MASTGHYQATCPKPTWESDVAPPILLKMIRSFLCQPNIRALSKYPSSTQLLDKRKREKTREIFSVTKHSHSDFSSETAMNGEGKGPDEAVVMEGVREKLVFMMGYLPGALPQRSPLLSPIAVRSPVSIRAWRDVCGGGCGFAMAISGAFFDLSFRFSYFCFERLCLLDIPFWNGID